MQPIALLATLALAALSAAGPLSSRGDDTCTPATYGCSTNPSTGVDGWQVCDTTEHWVYAGDCPPKTHCYFSEANGSPYCIP